MPKRRTALVSPAVGESKPEVSLREDPRPAQSGWWHRPIAICLLLAVATCIVFWPVGQADFVNYDDADYASANAHVQRGLTWENVRWAFTTSHASNWHPVTWLSHMLDCQLFGIGPQPVHRVNVAFHMLNTLLVFLVLRRLTGAHWRSAVVAGLFALHPLHVESVAWISERKDVLSGFFFLLTLWAWTNWIEKAKGGNPRRMPRSPGWYGLAMAFFALGLMSKPMLVTLPFLLLLLDYWPLDRLAQSRGAEEQITRWRAWVGLVVEKLPFFILALVSCIITFLVQKSGGAVSTSVPLGGRLANAAVSFARYLGKTFWPVNLSVLYPHPGFWPVWAVAASTALLVAIFGVVVWQRRRRPYLVVGWLWFCGGLIPVIGLVQVGIQSMADRYMYLPSIGLFVAVVWAITGVAAAAAGRLSLQPSPSGIFVTLVCGAGLALLICAVLTRVQVGYWRNSETLFRHALEVTSKNYLAYNNLGYYLSNQGRSAEAMDYYAKSLAINPNYEDALNNMGFALAGQKKHLAAIPYYEAALKVRPNQVEVHNNLGNAFSETGRIDDAIKEYLFVLREDPEHADAHNNLGIALAMQGKLDEAIEHFRATIRLKPKNASAHSNLGNALAAQRKFDDATREYLESLRLNPADAQAHNNLGNVLAQLGRVDEAIAHYREALRLNADNPEAHFNLGLALAHQGDRPGAVAHLNEALRLKPNNAEVRNQLQRLMATDPAATPTVPK